MTTRWVARDERLGTEGQSIRLANRLMDVLLDDEPRLLAFAEHKGIRPGPHMPRAAGALAADGAQIAMCSSARITSSAKASAADQAAQLPLPNTNLAPIMRLDDDGHRELARLRWGRSPGSARDAAIGGKTFNARAATVAEKLAFRDADRQQRCLVPADGVDEWAFGGGRE